MKRTPTRPATQDRPVPSDGKAIGSSCSRDAKPTSEAAVAWQAADEFYREITKRPDIRAILARLAKS